MTVMGIAGYKIFGDFFSWLNIVKVREIVKTYSSLNGSIQSK